MGRRLRKTKSIAKAKIKGVVSVPFKSKVSEQGNEKIFKVAFNNAVDAGFWADTKTGKIINCNKAAERLLERKRKDIIGMHQTKLHPPYAKEHYRKIFREHVKSKNVFDREVEILTKSGKIKYVRITAAVIPIGNKSVIQGIFHDITEQKKIREELIRSEEKYKSLVANAPIGIYYNDFNGKFLYANKMAEKIVGYKSKELVGKSFFKAKLISPKDLNRAAELLALNKLGKGTGPDEFILNKKDGSKADVLITTRPVIIEEKRLVLGMVEDITERKLAEEALRQSEEKLRSLVDSAPNFIMIINADGIIQFINRTAPGLTREEAIGRPIYDFIQPKYHAVVRNTINYIFKTGKASSYEIQGVGPDGRISWYVTNVAPIKHHGKVIAVTQIAADITERKKAEEELKNNERFLQSVFDGIQDGISVLDIKLNVVRVNKWVEKMFASHTPLVGKKCYEAYHKRQTVCPWCPSVKAVKDGKTHAGVIPYAVEEKLKGWFFLSAYPLKDENGKVIGVIESVRDITEQKKAEEALRESEERYRLTIDSIADAIHVIDSELRIILINKAFLRWCEQLGISKKVIGKRVLEAFPFLPSKIEDECREVFSSGKPLITEEVNNINGIEIITETRKIPVFEAGKVIRVVTVIRDITERRHMERLRENLIRDVSHSLKTPVAMLEMANDIGQRGIETNDTQRIKKAMDLASKNVIRLRKDINNILEVYVLSKAIGARPKEKSSLRKVINEIAENIKYVIEEKGLSFEINIDSRTDKILIIERELYTLLLNIIDNAVKFTNEGEILLSTKLKNNCIQIKVEDTGCGLTPFQRDMVFERFYKRSSAMPGMGLGLNISKEIVEKYGGKIEIFSKGLGKGVTVIIELPRK
ncbi:MAG: PAS domain S-box protein [Candidatus Omnitrophota bacterium]|nr:MAG: PAS domain S-box protein [Candidatus Omnitrophota bacterium]